MSNLVELIWEFDTHGYMLDEKGKNEPVVGSFLWRARDAFGLSESAYGHVVPRGGPPEWYKCRADNHDALIDLLNMPETPEGVLGFVGRWGLLKPPSEQDYQRISMFVDHRYTLDHIFAHGLPLHAGEQNVASLELIHGPTGGFSLRANTLADFLWAQVSLLKTGEIYQCPICKQFALRKTPRGSTELKLKLGRTPRYCSDACSSKAYRQGLTTRVADGGRQNRSAPRAHTRTRT